MNPKGDRTSPYFSGGSRLKRYCLCKIVLLAHPSVPNFYFRETTKFRNPHKISSRESSNLETIFVDLKPGPSLFISWLSNSQMLLSSSWASLLSL